MRPSGKAYDLPTPKVAVGAKVIGFKLDAYSRYRWMRHMLSEHHRIVKRMRLEGYLAPEPGDSLLPKRLKDVIRRVIRIVDTAYEIEVAGIQGEGFHLHLHPANGCYVGGGSGWSGMTFYYQLLFRAFDEGNHVVVLQPSDLRLFPEYQIIKLVKEAANG
jgi:hypothetical protein